MQTVIHVMYMVASVLFIVGIKQLSTVKTARSANAFSAFAMLIAIVAAMMARGQTPRGAAHRPAIPGEAVGQDDRGGALARRRWVPKAGPARGRPREVERRRNLALEHDVGVRRLSPLDAAEPRRRSQEDAHREIREHREGARHATMEPAAAGKVNARGPLLR